MLVCASCGKENPGGARFCNECAAPLAEQPALPALEERKVVSVLFCDLVGFTAASERQDPEDVRARIRPYHARLREEVERYGGTVEKFIGDAVMAVFGAPVAHEDDAERAVRSGLRILEAIEELNESDASLALQVRIGINTGEAVVALGARPEQGEGMVTGDVVNTAARLQAAAPVGGVAVGEQTYRQTKELFEYEQLEPVAVKGKGEAVPLWQATAARSRFGTDITRAHTSPLVGRELEKPLLIGTFERARQQRSVQLLTVVGEPGVGKSRLVSELLGFVDAQPELTRWRQGRCLPYGEGITFWALGEIVKAEAGILESDSAETAAAKLETAVSPEEAERPWLLQRLAPLVGAESAVAAERQELFTAWRRFLESLAAARPTVLVFEDLHWADEALLAFIEHLAEWAGGVPLLVLCTARPELYERRPGWGAGQRNAQTINLSPLSDQETAELVSALLAQTVLSAEVERALLERAGGNPLYAEEFVRLLNDRGPAGDAHALSFPDSVQALIAARLDTLSGERKGLLQDASVLGKVFWAGALTQMNGRDLGEVELALHELARKELVRPARSSSMAGEAEYAFWHVLVRDVAYAQIPRAARAAKHRAAAAWIEQRAGERVEDLAEVLAHHYLAALELARAAGEREQAEQLAVPTRRFLALAGERALGLDTAQAERRLAQALELTPAEDPERPELLLRWADAAFQAGRSREAAAALEQALAAFRARGEREAEARALIQLSLVASWLGEGRALALAAEAVALLQAEQPGPTLVDAHARLASTHFIIGSLAEAVAAADQAITLSERLGLPESARLLGIRGAARDSRGGLAEMERALPLLVEQGAGRAAAVLQNNLALARYPLEGPARSLDAFEQGIAFSEQRGLAEVAATLAANCPGLLAELGRPDEALARVGRLAAALEASGALGEVRAVELTTHLARGERETAPAEADWLVESARTGGQVDVIVVALAAAAEARLAAGQRDQARTLLDELEQTPGARATPYYARQLTPMLRTALAADDAQLAARLTDQVEPRTPLNEHALCAARAQLAEHAGEHAHAATLYAEAAARWQQFGNVPERAHALLGHGRCLLARGEPGAQAPLAEARELFASMRYLPALTQTEALLEQTAASARSLPRS